jgi:DNA-binding LacI/PurR family transcriptional regulator
MMAIGGLKALNMLGFKVPDDISIVGFDNVAISAFTCPALTTIHLPKFEMGQQGAHLIISLIENTEFFEKSIHPLGVQLVVRESSGPAPH